MSFTDPAREISANYTVQFCDHTIFANTSGGGFRLTLPANPFVGHRLTIKDFKLSFHSGGNLLIDPNGFLIEQIHTPGFAALIAMKTDGQSGTWEFVDDGKWYLLDFYDL